MYQKIVIQPAESWRPGQVEVTVETGIAGGDATSTSFFLPEQLLYTLSGMVESYRTKPQKMFAVEELSDE